MRLAVSTYSLARWRSENRRTLEDSLTWIADAGVEGVEFSGSFSDDPQAARKRAAAMRIRCDDLGVGGDVGGRVFEQRLRRLISQRLQRLTLGSEVGVAPQLDQGGGGLVVRDGTEDTALARFALGERRLDAFLAEVFDGLFDVAADFLERLLTFHHGLAGFGAEFVDHLGGDVCHVLRHFP